MNERHPLTERTPLTVGVTVDVPHALEITTPVHRTRRPIEPKWRHTLLTATACLLLLVGGLSFHPRPSLEAESPPTTPFSSTTPETVARPRVTRPENTKPFHVWDLYPTSVKPTNDWWENLAFGYEGATDGTPDHFVFTLPYQLDLADLVHRGLRVMNTNVTIESVMNRYCQVIDCAHHKTDQDPMLPPDLAVVSNVNTSNAVSLSSHLRLNRPYITSGNKLAVELTWFDTNATSAVKAPIVLGMPYVTMEHYGDSLPLISFDQHLHGPLIVDKSTVQCDGRSFTVRDELEFTLRASDETWIVFFSSSVRMVCNQLNSSTLIEPEAKPSSDPDVESLSMVVRMALVTNCTTGNGQGCQSTADPSTMRNALKQHALVYPSKSSQVTTSVSSSEEGTLVFDWRPSQMKSSSSSTDILMWALPHHLLWMDGDESGMQSYEDLRRLSIRGMLVPVRAPDGVWTLDVPLVPNQFTSHDAIDPVFLDGVNAALDGDLDYKLPRQLQLAGGTTYDGGKMLAKMARLALIAEELQRKDDAVGLAVRLADQLDVWLDSSTALSPLLYDVEWGGVVSCGCYYDKDTETCTNEQGSKCPALSDLGQNFGHGFYQDHHFHFGYFVYAAATVAHFLPHVGARQFDHMSLLIRDFANPTLDDPLFPQWRHKDWYLGLSWASGITKHEWGPDPHGRNQESVSEAVNAYDAVALYGSVMAKAFTKLGDLDSAAACQRIRDTGRMMLATEVQAARSYWQVCDDSCGYDTPRTYPSGYLPKVVGQIWSTTAETQTWFGPDAWKVDGIQLIPETAVSSSLWNPTWVAEMLPGFSSTCERDPTNCVMQGWSTFSWGAAAVLGGCRIARDHILQLPSSVYETPGGNGQSKTNALWWAAKQCPTNPLPQ